MNKVELECCGENGYPFYRIPGLIIADNGWIIAYYECRNGGDWSVSDIACKISKDGGKTFGARRILVSGKGYDLVHSPVMFVKEGILYFLWMRNYCECYIQRSTDNGETFEQPVQTDVFEEFRRYYPWSVAAAGPGHGITLENGRMLVAVWLAHNLADRTKHRPSKIATIFSDDGQNWHAGEILETALINPSESVLAQLPDGRVMINIRHENEQRRRAVSYSIDGISGWSTPVLDNALPDPVCAAGMTQFGNTVYFLNCAAEGFDDKANISALLADSRIALTLKSLTDGKWTDETLIDEYGGYSDVFANEKIGKMACVYEGGRKQNATHWSHFRGLYAVVLDKFLKRGVCK